MNPTFTLIVGPMFSGKTSRLLAMIDRFKYQKKSILTVKPKMDDRYSKTEIKTHSGVGVEAVSVASGKDVIDLLLSDVYRDIDIIAVDEAFMIDGVADVLIKLFKLGKTILVSSLDMSASCSPFDEVTLMLPWATHIEKCPAVCSICQRDAYYTHRKEADISEIHVGGDELYEPRCWMHHACTNELAS